MTARTVLIPTALFMLRHLLEALGVDVPEKTTKIKYSKYVGRKIGITVEDGEFNNKPTSDVNDFIDPDMIGADEDEDDLDDEDDDDEDDDDEDDDDEESDEDGDNLDDLSRKELKEYIAEEELDVKVKKSMDEDDIREAIREADREAEGDSDEDDDEEMDEVDLDEL